MRIFALVLSAVISACVTFRSASGYIRTSGLLRYPHSRLLSAQVDEITYASSESIRKWFLKTNNRRPEVFISESSTKSAVIADTWKSVLTSLRVLEKDETMKEYTAVFAFPKLSISSYPSPSAAIAEFEQISEAVERHLNESSPLFQPTFKRKVQFHVQPDESDSGSGTLLMSLDTRRVKSTILEYDDIDDYVPPVEDALTNDIENFPFPTVFDFVSEINRPPDPFTMSELRFKFKIQDFKYDLTKMAKKKNPQEVVDGINCKLTRLATWRDVLSAETSSMPDPFSETADWSDRVKMKYQSLKALAQSDPKRALETQYDKRATFIRIIDLWSDRLKRAFKFIYQSQRPPEDFITPIMNSRWRNEVLNSTRLFSQVPFIDFGGPSFEPGAPAPMFREDREILWKSDYSVEEAMTEMLLWVERVEKVHSHLGEAPSFSYLGPISQHTYSRGLVTERVLMDVWLGMARWLSGEKKAPLNPSEITSVAGYRKTPGGDRAGSTAASSTAGLLPGASPTDHSDDFISVLKAVNQFTRDQSMELGKNVKEMYRDWFHQGREMSEWWTTTVRNLDLVAEMNQKAEDRTVPWSEIMTGVVDFELARENGGVASESSQKSGENIEEISGEWGQYRPLMQRAEQIQSNLPWVGLPDDLVTGEGIEKIRDMGRFNEETSHVNFVSSADSTDGGRGGYLLVLPRFFRGIGLAEELSAFLEFCQIVSQDVKAFASTMAVPPGMAVEVVPLHPQMINAKGVPDYARRAPHPALLFRLVKA